MTNKKAVTSKPPKQIKKRHVAGAAILAAMAGAAAHQQMAPQPAPQPAPAQEPTPVCDAELWNHIYHPERLHIIDSCRRVTGTVELLRQEKDGDDHILVRVDSQYANMLNSVNQQKQNGDLVLEIICQHTVTQVDAIQACMNYQNQIPEPAVGERVVAIGSYVTDSSHGGHAELHPLTSLSRQ